MATFTVDISAVSEILAQPIDVDEFDWKEARSACRATGVRLPLTIHIQNAQRTSRWVQTILHELSDCEEEGRIQYIFQ